MNFEKILSEGVVKALNELYNVSEKITDVAVQKTRREFKGDFTVVVFPFLKYSKKSPDQTAQEIGQFLTDQVEEVESYGNVKGFLNISIHSQHWFDFFQAASKERQFGYQQKSSGKTVMVEYSSPNTNKPLHLGHIRNNFLGDSVSRILEANGHKVIRTQIINDRGIHICKSMLAWLRWGDGETPKSTGVKGDHLVGKYYVLFDKKYKEEIQLLMEKGKSKEEAEREAPLIIEARELLKKWEAKDAEVYDLWKKMNGWVYEGFDATYEKMGVTFDKLYYESDTYVYGKDEILEGLKNNTFFKKDDGSVWANLEDKGLDEKILLRSDGTSVYMTQDVGTAIQRFKEYKELKSLTYVVGNEQDYHFKALFIILDKLGYSWANDCFHLSYGMVDLPTGKMKSREGTVVDADDLIEEMIDNAQATAQELGKLDDFSEEEKKELYKMVGLGALKYFILKVDPKKRMMFDPQESIDFNGNTGPFIQYTHARIQSILRKAEELKIDKNLTFSIKLGDEERTILRTLYEFPKVIEQAGEDASPSVIANYTYDLVKEYNHFYQTVPILKGDDPNILVFRLVLSDLVGNVIRLAMEVLGIKVPNKM